MRNDCRINVLSAGLLALCVPANPVVAQTPHDLFEPAALKSTPVDTIAETGRQNAKSLPGSSHTIHGSVRGSAPSDGADHPIAILLDRWSENSLLGVEWFGYVQQGVTFNPASPLNRINGPVLPNYRSNDYQFNGLYLVSQRLIDPGCDRIQLGGRADLLHGTDGAFNLSDGLDQNISSGSRFYKLAIPQLYGKLYLPVGRGISFKFGKFFTPIGNEVKYNPINFFYSYYLGFNITPGNHTGVLGETELTDRLHVRFGPNFGWNTSENSNRAISYAGDLRWQSDNKQTELTFAMQTGNQRTRIVTADSLVNVYSLIFKQKINCRTHFLLEHDLLNSDSRTSTATDNFEAYSLASYLFYKLNDDLRAGIRTEWLRDDDGFVMPFGTDAFSAPGSYYNVTLGINWSAKAHLRIRPEIRYDWQVRDDSSLPASFDDGNATQQWLFACDAIWEF